MEGDVTLWAAGALPLIRISVRGSNKSQDYAFLYYIQITPPVVRFHKTIGCVCLRRSKNDEIGQFVGQRLRICWC